MKKLNYITGSWSTDPDEIDGDPFYPGPFYERRPVECGHDAELVVADHDMLRMARMAASFTADPNGDTAHGARWAMAVVDRLLTATANPTSMACPYTGDIDVEIENGEARWTCPVCDHEHVTPNTGF